MGKESSDIVSSYEQCEHCGGEKSEMMKVCTRLSGASMCNRLICEECASSARQCPVLESGPTSDFLAAMQVVGWNAAVLGIVDFEEEGVPRCVHCGDAILPIGSVKCGRCSGQLCAFDCTASCPDPYGF